MKRNNIQQYIESVIKPIEIKRNNIRNGIEMNNFLHRNTSYSYLLTKTAGGGV